MQDRRLKVGRTVPGEPRLSRLGRDALSYLRNESGLSALVFSWFFGRTVPVSARDAPAVSRRRCTPKTKGTGVGAPSYNATANRSSPNPAQVITTGMTPTLKRCIATNAAVATAMATRSG